VASEGVPPAERASAGFPFFGSGPPGFAAPSRCFRGLSDLLAASPATGRREIHSVASGLPPPGSGRSASVSALRCTAGLAGPPPPTGEGQALNSPWPRRRRWPPAVREPRSSTRRQGSARPTRGWPNGGSQGRKPGYLTSDLWARPAMVPDLGVRASAADHVRCGHDEAPVIRDRTGQADVRRLRDRVRSKLDGDQDQETNDHDQVRGVERKLVTDPFDQPPAAAGSPPPGPGPTWPPVDRPHWPRTPSAGLRPRVTTHSSPPIPPFWSALVRGTLRFSSASERDRADYSLRGRRAPYGLGPRSARERSKAARAETSKQSRRRTSLLGPACRPTLDPSARSLR
jgi:hypothetical protein